MHTSTTEIALRPARAAVFGIFGLNGFLLAMWVVHIPSITARTGVSDSTLGLLILLLAIGAIVGMQGAGPLADHFGSRRLVLVAAGLLSLATIGPGLATGPVSLGIALALFGFTNGALDVSMNAQAVHVERLYSRPIMAAFHAFFSCGGLLGAVVGAGTLHAGWDIRYTLAGALVLGLIGTATCVHYLLPHVRASTHRSSTSRAHAPKVIALALIAFALLLSEGVANDWSTLQVKQQLGSADSIAALAFGAFSVMMTLGRFTADRISAAIGPVAVVRYGTLVSAAGMALVLASGGLGYTFAGWALFGLGLSGCIPQIFTAAGNLTVGSAATNMSRVFGIGYFGLLAGPAVIGWLTNFVSLTTAMAVPLAAVLLSCCFAGVVRPASSA